jgi:BirA family biotin operon repressor/biotin-[acetyl-CoA-carboxylase] ligase
LQSNIFLTRFVGHHLVKLVKVDSTNNYLKSLLSNFKPLPIGSVIMAESQFAGRGQSNNVWLSQSGKNLTFSIYLKPDFLSSQKQFKLNEAIALGITDCLVKMLGDSCKIKWPNDIYYKDDKIGGILIENTIRGQQINESIVGIGLNVNQTEFTGSLKNANSLTNILGVEFDLMNLLADILKRLEDRYLQLEADRVAQIDKDYINRLFRYQQNAKFIVEEKKLSAKIVGVNDTGLLILETATGKKTFNFKEIRFVV